MTCSLPFYFGKQKDLLREFGSVRKTAAEMLDQLKVIGNCFQDQMLVHIRVYFLITS